MNNTKYRARTERYSLRIVDVSGKTVKEMNCLFSNIKHNVGEYFKNKKLFFAKKNKTDIKRWMSDDPQHKDEYYQDNKRYVISFDIVPKKDYSGLEQYLLMHKATMHYGLWVSLGTNRDSDGVAIPKHICELYKRIGGTIDFSFTVL